MTRRERGGGGGGRERGEQRRGGSSCGRGERRRRARADELLLRARMAVVGRTFSPSFRKRKPVACTAVWCANTSGCEPSSGVIKPKPFFTLNPAPTERSGGAQRERWALGSARASGWLQLAAAAARGREQPAAGRGSGGGAADTHT